MTEALSDAVPARAFWIVEPGRGEIRRSLLPPLAAGEVRVAATVSGISRGTESLVFRGKVPQSQYQAMRCPFQDGEFPGPVKYGYASVGRVEVGPDALLGSRVFCLHPHQDRYDVPADAVLPIPDAVTDERAALAANMETAINALWDAAPRLGDRIAVVGAGIVGSLVASLAARLPGTRVTLVDTNPRRRDLAAVLGCDFAAPGGAPGDADLVIHASGSEAGLATALGLAGFEATVLELSWYGTAAIAAPLGEAFHSRRLTLRASQVGAVAPARRARWSHRRRLALALDLLADPVYDHLLTGESGFAELPMALARLAAAPGDALCRIVRYP
ncbi:MAG TPA: zinc-binding alcohol dehydrogenase [Stellaceae bacterium]|nr:zinc-binding alcohol dehydrogenase [Stellaceae bacterium]